MNSGRGLMKSWPLISAPMLESVAERVVIIAAATEMNSEGTAAATPSPTVRIV